MKLLLASCGFAAIAVTPVFGAEKPVIPVAAPHHQTTPQDSGKWKREPFVTKKGNSVVTGNNGLINLPSKTVVKGSSEFTIEEDVNLQGIMTSGTRYHALINGRVVKPGDEIGGVIIKDISRYAVLVMNSKKEKVLYDIYQGRIVRGKK